MIKIIPSIILVFLLIFAVTIGAEASDDAGRMDVINRELDCFSDAASRGKVNWNDICVTNPSVVQDIISDAPVRDRDEIVAKSMEQMIEEHRQAAQEMLDPQDEEQIGRAHV